MDTPDTRSLYRSERGHREMMAWYDGEFERLSHDVLEAFFPARSADNCTTLEKLPHDLSKRGGDR